MIDFVDYTLVRKVNNNLLIELEIIDRHCLKFLASFLGIITSSSFTSRTLSTAILTSRTLSTAILTSGSLHTTFTIRSSFATTFTSSAFPRTFSVPFPCFLPVPFPVPFPCFLPVPFPVPLPVPLPVPFPSTFPRTLSGARSFFS